VPKDLPDNVNVALALDLDLVANMTEKTALVLGRLIQDSARVALGLPRTGDNPEASRGPARAN